MKRAKKRRDRFGKKAQHPSTLNIHYIASIIIASFVIVSFIRFAYYGAGDQGFRMQYFANDIGVVMDTLYSVPGDVIYEYKKDPNEFIINFKDKVLWVYTPQRLISNKFGSYNYMASPEKTFSDIFNYPVSLTFRKTGSYVEASENGVFKVTAGCPQIDTSADIKQKFIMIDPGNYEGDPGLESNNRQEFRITKAIADSMFAICQTKGMKCRVLQQAAMPDKLKEMAQQQKPDMIISIHMGTYSSPDDNPVKVTTLILSDNDDKLACMINGVFSGMPYASLDTKKISFDYIQPGDQEALFKKDIPSVLIEIGNIKNPGSLKDNKGINEAASGIIEAVGNYYKPLEAGPQQMKQIPVQQGQQQQGQQQPQQPAGPKAAETKTQGKVKVTTQ